MKPQPLRGFRDYLPEDMLAKERMLDTVRAVFESHGYPPVATPALEYAELLLGKYGDEGEMLMYRFRDNGDRDVAMRYDLTVPLARLVATHGGLPMPFRRYQIAPVWRAEKPAKGRFREFVQCDVDLVGVDDASADAEMLLIGQDVLRSLGVASVRQRVNHRGVLRAITRVLGLAEGEEEGDFLRLLDKLDKIGAEKFRAAFAERFPAAGDAGAQRVLEIAGGEAPPRETLARLEGMIGQDPDGAAAIERLRGTLDRVEAGGSLDLIEVDPSIARGLSYYTGIIYETFLGDLPEYGSVMSGGRYDGLVGMFAGRDLPAVGISLGVDRLFAALLELGSLEVRRTPSEVLVVQFSEEGSVDAFRLAAALRSAGISVLVHPQAAKLKKQFQAANALGIPFTAGGGRDEAARGTLQLKEMGSGEQVEVDVAEAVRRIRAGVEGEGR
ncbi:MAG: histidine--tRNA ligase [Planctomycetota bacterium]